MDKKEQLDEVVALGAVSSETHGSSPIGLQDTQPNTYFSVMGLDADD